MGFLCEEAYARISDFEGDKDAIRIGIWIYRDQAAREEDLACIDQFRIELPIQDGATIADMYTAMKLIDPFTGAQDC